MNKCKIVAYHYVRPIKNSQYPEIKGLELEEFKKQIEYFRKEFNFITAKQMIDCIYENRNIPDRSILLTFDDGLKDNYLHVFPILKKFKIQGLFFPPVKPIIEKIVLDVHKIHFILAMCKNKKQIIDIIFKQINQYKNEYNLQDPSSYYSQLAKKNRFDTDEIIFIKRILQRELPLKLRKIIIQTLFKKFVTTNEKDFSENLYLSIEEIKEMKESDMYFGSHGYSHVWFSYLSEHEKEVEVEESLKFFHKLGINTNNLIMCYPYGDYDKEIINHLKKRNFKAGLTVKMGDSRLDKLNAFSLERYDTNDFKDKII
jgi:peptidoglycan/xylan/chitin deacetylase (PgdA/CDA1 family)|tara:strand:- start:249 stop:1190 length:942 start_codon:yes stop_codon:yes gene_type:complete